MNKIFKYCMFHFSILLSISANAQSDSLMKYLEIAAQNNPLVLQRFNEYQAALQKVPQAGSLQNPELSVGIFLTPMELVGGNQVADIRLMQMFPWFGVLKNAKDEMSLMAKSKFEAFRDTKLQLFFDLQKTWFELQKIQQNINISEKNLEILRTLERISIVKYKSAPVGGNTSSSSSSSSSVPKQNSASSGSNGMGGSNQTSSNNSSSMQAEPMVSQSGITGLADLYQIQIEMGELENSIALLHDQETTTVTKFNTYLNRPVNSVLKLPDAFLVDSLTISLITVSDSMLVNNPMLGMYQYEQQSLGARKNMVTKMGYPMIGLGVNYSLINKNEMSTNSMNGADMIMPMVTVTLPIYRKKYKAMQKEAEFLQNASTQAYYATANTLKNEYQEAIQMYLDADRRIKLYEKQALLAKKTLDITIKSFSVSGSGLNDVLRIRQQTLNYEFKRIEAITDFNISIAWLNRLMASSKVE